MQAAFKDLATVSGRKLKLPEYPAAARLAVVYDP